MSFRLKAPRLTTSENDVRNACLDVLRMRGWWPVRQHVGRFKTIHGNWITIGETGDPDYAVMRDPAFFLETKRPGNELSPEQVNRIQILKRLCGLETIVVDDVEQLLAWLDRRAEGP